MYFRILYNYTSLTRIKPRDHPITTYAKCSEKLKVLNPKHAHISAQIKRGKKYTFSENSA